MGAGYKPSEIPAGTHTSMTETRLISISIYQCDGQRPVKLAGVEDLSGFGYWYRSTAGELIRFGSRQVAARTPPGTQQSVAPSEEDARLPYLIHACSCLTDTGVTLVGTMVTDEAYDVGVVFRMLKQLMYNFQRTHGAGLGSADTSLPREELALDFPP